MVRLKRSWGNERVFQLSELVKQPDFPIKRSHRTISNWARYGVETTRGSFVAFPTISIAGVYHSSIQAAREFVAYLGKRSAEAPAMMTKARKKRAKVAKPVQSDGRMRRVN